MGTPICPGLLLAAAAANKCCQQLPKTPDRSSYSGQEHAEPCTELQTIVQQRISPTFSWLSLHFYTNVIHLWSLCVNRWSKIRIFKSCFLHSKPLSLCWCVHMQFFLKATFLLCTSMWGVLQQTNNYFTQITNNITKKDFLYFPNNRKHQWMNLRSQIWKSTLVQNLPIRSKCCWNIY